MNNFSKELQVKACLKTPYIIRDRFGNVPYRLSHQLESRDLVCLLSELATGWKAGSSFHSALGGLATPVFIYKKSLLSS